MRLSSPWRCVARFWDSLFEASDFGLIRLFRRRRAKPFRFGTRPRKRSYIPWGEGLEERQLMSVLSGITDLRVRHFAFADRGTSSRGRESTRAGPTTRPVAIPRALNSRGRRGEHWDLAADPVRASFLSRGLGESDSFDTISPVPWPKNAADEPSQDRVSGDF